MQNLIIVSHTQCAHTRMSRKFLRRWDEDVTDPRETRSSPRVLPYQIYNHNHNHKINLLTRTKSVDKTFPCCMLHRFN